MTALLYLFIGLFIFVRRWNAPRAVHFYVFCLASFVLYSFHYTGKLNSFDWTVYWSNVVALLLQPALLVHFALVFPERRAKVVAAAARRLYGVPAALLALHMFVATAMLDFLPSMSSRDFLATLELFYVGVYFLLRGGDFSGQLPARAERRAEAAAEVGDGWNVRGHFPFLPALRGAAPGDRGAAAVDEAVRVFPGADPACRLATPSSATA